MKRTTLLAIAATFISLPAVAEPLRIGVLGDQGGPYSGIGGPGAVLAAKMAVEDFGAQALGRPVEIISADMQNKPDIATGIARKWFDQEGVEAIVDLPTSSVALAVNEIGREKKKLVLVTAAATDELTTTACSPYTVQVLEDTHALARGMTKAVIAAGGRSWFFLTPDFAFGYAMEKAAQGAIDSSGGKVVGSVKYPITTTDYSSFLLRAQSSNADVIGISGVGGAAISVVKQAVEFGLTDEKHKLAIFLQFITDVHGLGLASSHGLYTVDGFYWDESPTTRNWSERFFKVLGKMPTKVQAYTYAVVLHYLKSVSNAGSVDADAVSAKMKSLPLDLFGKAAQIRGNGRAAYDLTLYEVKSPAESHYAWDYYKPIRNIPATEAFGPDQESSCKSIPAK